MGNVLGFMCKRMKEKRILFQGLDAAGKTTILYKLKLGEVVTTIPTIGFNVETIAHKNINITAWDVGGRDKIRPLYRHYYSGTDALVFVIDSTDRERFDEVLKEIERTIAEEELHKIPFAIAANKQDKEGAMTAQEISERIGFLAKDPSRLWTVIPTCAITGNGLYDVMDWIVNATSSDPSSSNTDQKDSAKKDDVEVTFMKKTLLKLKYIILDA